jgi:hypothetical protein
MVIDSIDFTWAQPSPNSSQPEDLIHDFMTFTGIKVGHIRDDGAGEIARSATFKVYCRRHNIVIEEVPAYTHTFNARAEGAIRICKDKVHAFLRRANLPRRFWPDALLHWCRTYAHWQITPTFDPADDGIWSELDLLEGDPVHREVAMRNPRHKPFWLRAEGDEWQGLWEKSTFKK